MKTNLTLSPHSFHFFISFTGTVISTIDSAAFGDFGNCPQTMAEASGILRAQCLGQTSCTPNFQALGSDPCPGHVKWMDAAWECAPPLAGGQIKGCFPPLFSMLLIMGLVYATSLRQLPYVSTGFLSYTGPARE